MSDYIIGIDIGTTSTKAVLFDTQGQVVGYSSQSYPIYHPTPEVAEQNPQQILHAVVSTIRAVVDDSGIKPTEIACLSWSAAMHSLIVVDAAGEPLTASITWADNRSARYIAQIAPSQQQELYCATGIPIHPMSPLTNLLWLRQEKPRIWQQAARFVSIKEWILGLFYGEWVVDGAIAAASGMFNLSQLDWHTPALALAEIEPTQLSEVVPTTHILPQLQSEWAKKLGINQNTPTVVGASDGVLSNLGLGAVKPGIVAVTVGTSGAVRTVVSKPQTDPSVGLFCYPLVKDYWIIGGASNSGGRIWQWLGESICRSETDTAELLGEKGPQLLIDIAANTPVGSEGLIFHPFLGGERCPLWNSKARGNYFGLGLHHSKAHIIRATLEGIIYNLAQILEALQRNSLPVEQIRATGGFFRSQLAAQTLADVFDYPVATPTIDESSCFGAAILAMLALEIIPSLEQGIKLVQLQSHYQPIPDHVQQYQEILPQYQNILAKLQSLW